MRYGFSRSTTDSATRWSRRMSFAFLPKAPNHVDLATLRANGAPRNHVVWVGLEGDRVLISTSDATRWSPSLGVVTDRDIVVKGIAADLDPRECTVRALIDTEPVCVGAQEEIEQAAARMAEHQVRRLPVVDGDRLVGMVAQADVVRALPPEQGGQVVQDISKDTAPGPSL